MSDEGKDDGFSISTSTDFRIRGIGQLGPALRALGGLVAVCVIAWVSDFSAEEAGRGDALFDIGIMPGWAYIGEPPEDLVGAWLTGSPERIAEELRADREVGANVFHLKFRSRTLDEYLDQLAAFGEEVRPLL